MENPKPSGNGKKDQGQSGQVRKGKVILSSTAHDVKFADFAQIVLTQTHGVIKFGMHQAGTDEFVVHSQVVMPPQALTHFAEGLKAQIDKIKEQQENPKNPQVEP